MLAPRRLASTIFDFILPPVCHCCGAETSGSGAFCAECFTHLRIIGPPYCVSCAVPVPEKAFLGHSGHCTACEACPPPWRQARAAFIYDEWSRKLILPLKYADRTENARLLASFMRRAGRDLLIGNDLLIPVPLHWTRLLRRRYNQAALLAHALGRGVGTPTCMPDVLKRDVMTQSLARLPSRERAREVQKAIVARRRFAQAIEGTRVLLIDDVLTTGATARVCTLALLDAGATSVDLLVAARTERFTSESEGEYGQS